MNQDSIHTQYLEPTLLVDFNTEIVKDKALELTSAVDSEIEKVKRIYHFVRDEIPYTFTNNLQKASDVLKEKVGQCNTKTTLTIALLRAVKIPSRYHCGSISKSLFKNTIPKWAYPFTPDLIPGHCCPEVFLQGKWLAIENVMDLNLYEGIQAKTLKNNSEAYTGCGLSKDSFQKRWDGSTDILMQDGALAIDLGTLANADAYLSQSENFINPLKKWIKDKFVKRAMNVRFDDLRKAALQ